MWFYSFVRCCCVVVSFAPVLFVSLSVSRPTAPACCAGSAPGPTGPEDRNNKRILTCRPRTARRRKRPRGGPGPQTPACNYAKYPSLVTSKGSSLAETSVRSSLKSPIILIIIIPFVHYIHVIHNSYYFSGKKKWRTISCTTAAKKRWVHLDIFHIHYIKQYS